jgi:hypothetical protein
MQEAYGGALVSLAALVASALELMRKYGISPERIEQKARRLVEGRVA